MAKHDKKHGEGASVGKKRAMLGLLIFFVVIIAFTFAASAMINGYEKVFPNTFVNGVEISGMTADEALAVFDKIYCTDRIEGLSVNIICDDNTASLPLDSLNIYYNNKEATANVFDSNGLPAPARVWKFIFCLLHKTEAEPVYEYDTEAFENAIADAAAGYEIEPVGVTFEIKPDKVVLHKQTDGIKANRSKLTKVFEAQLASVHFEDLYAELESIHPDDLDFDEFYSWLTSDAEDAYYEKDENGIVTIHPEKLKCTADKSEVKSATEKLKTSSEQTVEFPVTSDEPENTAERLSQILYKDKLSSYSTNYGGSAARVNNVQIATNRINGYELLPGEEFSYDQTILPRTAENGYRAAPVYVGNKVESGMGGGICQPSSTLYCAAMYANLEITERHNHSLMVSYLPPGLDATIAQGVLDLKFKNNTPYPVKISSSAANGTVTFSIWGYNPDNYSVELLRSGGGYMYQVTRIVKKDGTEISRQQMASSRYGKPEEEKKEKPPEASAAPQPTQTPAAENNFAAQPQTTENQPMQTTGSTDTTVTAPAEPDPAPPQASASEQNQEQQTE